MEKEKKNGFENICVRRDGKRDLSFSGKTLSWATTWTDRASRWMEATLYETKAGKYVISVRNITLWQDEENGYEGYVAKTLEDVFMKAFPEIKNGEVSWLAKELADGIIDLSERIE